MLRGLSTILAVGLLCAAAGASTLTDHGYSIIPPPQQVTWVDSAEVPLGANWNVSTVGVATNDVSVEVLRDSLKDRFGLPLGSGSPGGGRIQLEVREGSVNVGAALDQDRASLARQAYHLEIRPSQITVRANAPTGLLYGVYSLVQLVKPVYGEFHLPQVDITDWPDLGNRHIYWDDAHHLERPEAFKRIIRNASMFKINGITLKLEGHFQFKSAPSLVEPYAWSPEEMRELTAYAHRYSVDLIPYLDAPAHIAFILKHPAYRSLRAFPDSNYELCAVNPDSYRLMEGMFQDLIDATPDVPFFYLSTDEPYYVGMANSSACNEKARADELGSRGKLLSEFIGKTAGYLHKHGRTVLFWGEYPLKVSDIPSLPNYLVNGEVYGGEFDRAYRSHGIRQMIYTSSQGEEKLFPKYFPLPQERLLHPREGNERRVHDTFEKIAFDSSRRDSQLIGVVNAGWGDMGLHPDSFWLGYASSMATAWNSSKTRPEELFSAFFAHFFAQSAFAPHRLFQLLSLQAQTWSDLWDVTDSKRKGIWGDSAHIFDQRHPAFDQTLALPSADLKQPSAWKQANAKRLQLAAAALIENDELTGLVQENLLSVRQNHFSMEVFSTIAALCRYNLDFLESLGEMDTQLNAARAAIGKKHTSAAVKTLDVVLENARRAKRERNTMYQNTLATWMKGWYPRVASANGRTFVHELDDVKDHLPDRTVDMSYLIYRDLELPMDAWFDQVLQQRNALAATAKLPARQDELKWKAVE